MGIKSIGRVAFDVLYETNVNKVYRLSLYYTKNTYTAEEITQNVFLKLYLYMEHIDMEAVPRWLLVTARNMSLNQRRMTQREVLFGSAYEEDFTEQAMISSENEFFQKCMEKEYSKLVESIFEGLYRKNERWYDAITITYCLKKPQKEVAEVMGISLETLHSILYRAKRWIKKHYQEQYNCLNKA